MMHKNYQTQTRITLSALCISIIISISILCNAADLIDEKKGQSGWKKVMDFGPVIGEPPTWCGNAAIVAKVYDWKTETGGIVYLDVQKNTTRWITRNPHVKSPSCSYDGSLIFMYKFRSDPQVEEGLVHDGLWEYDLKTDKSRKISNMSTDFVRNAASPSRRIFAIVAREKEDLKAIEVKLPGWRILTFPKSDRKVSNRAQWASDGSYFLLRLLGKNRNEDLEFYDSSGVLVRTISTDNLQMAFKGSSAIGVKKDGIYWIASDEHLRRLDVKTGQIDQLSFQSAINKKKSFTFDILPAQEIAYTRHDRNNELWIESLRDKKSTNVFGPSAFPVFSKTGEYLTFIHSRDENGNYTLSVLKR